KNICCLHNVYTVKTDKTKRTQVLIFPHYFGAQPLKQCLETAGTILEIIGSIALTIATAGTGGGAVVGILAKIATKAGRVGRIAARLLKIAPKVVKGIKIAASATMIATGASMHVAVLCNEIKAVINEVTQNHVDWNELK
ncbi:MAG: hypothetical protein K6F08_01360, partial [bacterium]|nr:hypothetical protein [bacterium]